MEGMFLGQMLTDIRIIRTVWTNELYSVSGVLSWALLSSSVVERFWKLKSFKGLVYYRYPKPGQIFVLVCPIKKDWLLEFVGIPFLPSVLSVDQRKLSSMIKLKEAGVISDVSFYNRKTSFY